MVRLDGRDCRFRPDQVTAAAGPSRQPISSRSKSMASGWSGDPDGIEGSGEVPCPAQELAPHRSAGSADPHPGEADQREPVRAT